MSTLSAWPGTKGFMSRERLPLDDGWRFHEGDIPFPPILSHTATGASDPFDVALPAGEGPRQLMVAVIAGADGTAGIRRCIVGEIRTERGLGIGRQSPEGFK